MPITGRTEQVCFDQFRDHIAGVFAKVLPTDRPWLIVRERNTPSRATASFRQQKLIEPVPLDCREYGRLYVSFAQLLEAVEESGVFRLFTLQYWYRIQAKPGPREQALMRWEYERELADGKKHCRHHLQQNGDLTFGAKRLDLNKAHVPTGWVTIEEVLRFLITDLGVEPPCGDAWDDVLSDSYRVFHEEFSGKRRG